MRVFAGDNSSGGKKKREASDTRETTREGLKTS